MTQEAKIVKILDENNVEAIVIRATACGSNCSNCESCIYQNEMHIEAFNKANAKVGENVIIESKSNIVYKAAFIMYIFPIVMLLLGYIVPYFVFKLNEGLSVLFSFTFFVISIFIIVITQKNKPSIVYNVVKILEE